MIGSLEGRLLQMSFQDNEMASLPLPEREKLGSGP